MKPFGKYIRKYRIFTYEESLDLVFEGEFEGISQVMIVKELQNKAKIQMTRKAFMNHAGKKKHFTFPEDYLEILNEPDFILYQKKVNFGHSLQIISKRKNVDLVGVVIIFTNLTKMIHKISTGFIITQARLQSYLSHYQIIWERK